MGIDSLITKALAIREKYAALETKRNGQAWTGEELMLGFVKDVGDLSKLIQAKENIRHVDDVDNKLAHELGDCLWSIIVIANHYNVDIEAAFDKTMQELDERLADP